MKKSDLTDGQKKAIADAGRMLAARMMTRKQLTEKLLERGHDPDDAAFAADSMEQLRAIDDLEYAHQYVRSRSASGYGAARIRRELKQRGVDEELIERALESLDPEYDESGMIEKYILSRARSFPIDRREASKISGALARKGFSWEDIYPILRKYTEEFD